MILCMGPIFKSHLILLILYLNTSALAADRSVVKPVPALYSFLEKQGVVDFSVGEICSELVDTGVSRESKTLYLKDKHLRDYIHKGVSVETHLEVGASDNPICDGCAYMDHCKFDLENTKIKRPECIIYFDDAREMKSIADQSLEKIIIKNFLYPPDQKANLRMLLFALQRKLRQGGEAIILQTNFDYKWKSAGENLSDIFAKNEMTLATDFRLYTQFAKAIGFEVLPVISEVHLGIILKKK